MNSNAITDQLDPVDLVRRKSREDETTPLIRQISNHDPSQTVDIDFNEDPRNPLNWTLRYKWAIVILVSCMTTVDVFSTIIIVPAVPEILDDFNEKNQLYSTLVVSIWELGEGLGPFLVAPLSEIFGRVPVYHVGNFLFLLCAIACASSSSIHMLVAFRFLSGFVTTCLTLGPSIIGDMFPQEQRGSAMSLAIFLPIFGPIVGPILGSFTADALGWRWTIWIMAIAVAVLQIPSWLFFRETYKPAILRSLRRSNSVLEVTEVPSTQEEEAPFTELFLNSFIRSIKIMFLSPVVLLLSTYAGLIYGIAYLVLTTITTIMEEEYGFTPSKIGLVFLTGAIGDVMAILLYGLTSDRYLKYKTVQLQNAYPGKNIRPPAEVRLIHPTVGGLIFPLGFLLYGWTSAYHTSYLLPLLGTLLVGFSACLVSLPIENYLVDLFSDPSPKAADSNDANSEAETPVDIDDKNKKEEEGGNSASAVASVIIVRAFFGAFLPLLGPPVYSSRLGLGWGNTLFALLAAVAWPVLFGLVRYGKAKHQREVLMAVESS